MTAILVALVAQALAQSVYVLPPGISAERAAAIRVAIGAPHGAAPRFVPAEEVLAAIDVVEVRGLPPDETCGAARVPVEDWRARFDEARRALQLLAFTDGLAQLVVLDAELECLAEPPATSDLFRLELAAAEAHTFLAQSAGRDVGKRRFHDDEARAALVRAAAFGSALSAPADLPPEVAAAYERVRERLDDEERPVVLVSGPGARVGARFNGRPLSDRPFDAAPGTNLVQAANGSQVTAAARVRLGERKTLIWLVPEGERPLDTDLDRALAAYTGAGPAADGHVWLLAAALTLYDPRAALLVDEGSVVTVKLPMGGEPADTVGPWILVESGQRRLPPRPVDRWHAVLGAGPSAGWSNLGAGPLDGLGGAHAGVAVYGRVAINDWLAAAAMVDPWAVAAPIPEAQGGGTLFRATIPAKLGVRFGPHTRRLAVEGGLDVGLHAFGTYDDAARMSFYAAAAGGISGAIGPRVAARAQGWFGAGLGYVGGGGTLGLEGRL